MGALISLYDGRKTIYAILSDAVAQTLQNRRKKELALQKKRLQDPNLKFDQLVAEAGCSRPLDRGIPNNLARIFLRERTQPSGL